MAGNVGTTPPPRGPDAPQGSSGPGSAAEFSRSWLEGKFVAAASDGEISDTEAGDLRTAMYDAGIHGGVDSEAVQEWAAQRFPQLAEQIRAVKPADETDRGIDLFK